MKYKVSGMREEGGLRMKGFTYQGDHFTWHEKTKAYWNDDPAGFWSYFKQHVIPKNVIWDKED